MRVAFGEQGYKVISQSFVVSHRFKSFLEPDLCTHHILLQSHGDQPLGKHIL